MLKEPSPEREKEIIDKVAKLVVDNDLAEFIYPLYDYCFKYFGNYLTSYASLELFPFSPLLGSMGTDFNIFLQSDPQRNMNRIMDRIRELDEKKKQEEAARHAAEGTKTRKSFWKKIKPSFSKK